MILGVMSEVISLAGGAPVGTQVRPRIALGPLDSLFRFF